MDWVLNVSLMTSGQIVRNITDQQVLNTYYTPDPHETDSNYRTDHLLLDYERLDAKYTSERRALNCP